MPQARQSYPQYNPSDCTSCKACLNNCPPGCIHFDPLFITSDECILCGQCISACPMGDRVLAQGSKLLGKEWQWFVPPPASETEENPSNPSENESSKEPNKGDSNKGDSSDTESSESDSSAESKGESQGNSTFTPTDKAKLEALKNALLSAPPPLQDTIKRKGHKRDRFTKAIHIHDELKSLIAYRYAT